MQKTPETPSLAAGFFAELNVAKKWRSITLVKKA
jgi:hypothetical protein